MNMCTYQLRHREGDIHLTAFCCVITMCDDKRVSEYQKLLRV